MSLLLRALEWVWPGDFLIRQGIRHLNRQRLQELRSGGVEAQLLRRQTLIRQLRDSPRALHPEQANRQHYEVPAAFFQRVLGQHLKYSCGYWPAGIDHLDQAESSMLELSCERAQVQDGQHLLDLGCGWGSLSLYLAQHFPTSQVLGISNSNSQREFILEQARLRGLSNLTIWTRDINALELPSQAFDRILSLEMLEHVRNYDQVFQLLQQALKPEGKLFVHVFAHREFAYTFDPQGRGGATGDWMEREFFSGGTMPSLDLFPHFQGDLRLEDQWAVEGTHYQKTAEAWLSRMRAHRGEIQGIFRQVYGRNWRRYWTGWQLFFLTCAEFFGHDRGQQWLVHHQRWSKA